MPSPNPEGHTFTIKVDGEELEVAEHDLTSTEIMLRSGIDPASNYLVEIRGKHRESYEGRPDEPIHIHEGLTLVSVFTGAKTVS